MESFKIKQLHVADWQDYRDLRLEALAKHPAYFLPSQDETKFKESDWKNRLANENAASFGLFFKDTMIGLTGIFRLQDDPAKAMFVSSYIREEYRKKGLSKLFYEARFLWAQKQKGLKTLIVEHRDDNLPSKKANQKFGFQLVDARDEKWPDGQVRKCLVYHLEL